MSLLYRFVSFEYFFIDFSTLNITWNNKSLNIVNQNTVKVMTVRSDYMIFHHIKSKQVAHFPSFKIFRINTYKIFKFFNTSGKFGLMHLRDKFIILLASITWVLSIKSDPTRKNPVSRHKRIFHIT